MMGVVVLLILSQSHTYRGSVKVSASEPENELSSTPNPSSSVLIIAAGRGEDSGDEMFNKYPKVLPPFQNDSPEGRKVLRFGVLSPQDVGHQYAMQKVLPPILMATQSDRIRNLLPGWDIETHYRDTKCSSTFGPLAAFDFYHNKTAGRRTK
jgi:hypothetical protein